MATATKVETTTELVSGADILVQSLVNHGVETIFAYPGGCSMPLHQALTRLATRSARSAPARTGRRLCRPGNRPQHRQSRRLHGDQRPGGHEPRHRHRRRQARQRAADRDHRTGADHGDRHRCVSGNADRRSLPRHHQAPLPGDRRQRRARVVKEAFIDRHHGPPGPGVDRHAQGRPARQVRARLRRRHRTCPAIEFEIAPRPAGADQADRRGHQAWPSGRSSTPAAGSSLATRAKNSASWSRRPASRSRRP